MPQLPSLCSRAWEPQLLSPRTTEVRAPQSPCSTAREATAVRSPSTTTTELPPLTATRDPAQLKQKSIKLLLLLLLSHFSRV